MGEGAGGGGGGTPGVRARISVFPSLTYRLVGLAIKASASRAASLSSIPTFSIDLCLGRVIQVTKKNWYYSGYPARRLLDSVSVYYD